MPVRVILRDDSLSSAGADPPSLTFDSPRIAIGRSDGCDVCLPDSSVSLRHATLRQHGGAFLLVDEGSSNGTFLGGVRVPPHAPRPIEDGALVRVGRVWLEIRFDATAAPSPPQETKELALALVQHALASMGETADARIVGIEGPDAGKALTLARVGEGYVLGRGYGVDLLLDDGDASRRHAQVTRKGADLVVRDLGSKNGTRVGETRLDPARDAIVRVGETFAIGKSVFRYENPAAEALAEIERAADEKMREGEAPPPPRGPNVDEAAAPPPGQARGDAPIAEMPKVAPPKPRREKKSGWGPSDFVIVVVAIAILAISIAGLVLLLRA